MDKDSSRIHLKKLINSYQQKYSKNNIKDFNYFLFQQVKDHFGSLKNKKIAVYKADKYEVSIEHLLSLLVIEGSVLYFPEVENKEMFFYSKDKNIRIDKDRATFFDFVFVPLLGVNNSNHRIGRGYGNYDKFFKKEEDHIEMWSFLFSKKQVINVENNNWDIKVNKVFFLEEYIKINNVI